uniref:Uncharacterized protein n=1 Tax=Oryza punctata TaxID=4537 RepID=A0A0E0LLN3_ORYPU
MNLPVVVKNWVSVSYRSEHLTPWIAPPIVPPPIFRRLSATTPWRQVRQRSGGMSRVHCASPYTVRTVRSLSLDSHGASSAAYLSGCLAVASASALRSSPTTSSNRSASAAGTVGDVDPFRRVAEVGEEVLVGEAEVVQLVVERHVPAERARGGAGAGAVDDAVECLPEAPAAVGAGGVSSAEHGAVDPVDARAGGAGSRV